MLIAGFDLDQIKTATLSHPAGMPQVAKVVLKDGRCPEVSITEAKAILAFLLPHPASLELAGTR